MLLFEIRHHHHQLHVLCMCVPTRGLAPNTTLQTKGRTTAEKKGRTTAKSTMAHMHTTTNSHERLTWACSRKASRRSTSQTLKLMVCIPRCMLLPPSAVLPLRLIASYSQRRQLYNKCIESIYPGSTSAAGERGGRGRAKKLINKLS